MCEPKIDADAKTEVAVENYVICYEENDDNKMTRVHASRS